MTYFPKADGKLASVEEITGGVMEWYGKHPELKGDEGKLGKFMRNQGWKQGPDVLAHTPTAGPLRFRRSKNWASGCWTSTDRTKTSRCCAHPRGWIFSIAFQRRNPNATTCARPIALRWMPRSVWLICAAPRATAKAARI